jgi:hypothetical protein
MEGTSPIDPAVPFMEAKPAPMLCGKCSKPKGERGTEGVCNCGRPTKYKDSFPKELRAWFDVPVTKEQVKTYVDKKGEVKEVVEMVANDFPTFEGFAADHDIEVQTMLEWIKNPELTEFAQAYAYARQKQANILIQNAMTGKYVSNFAGLAAKNLHNWKEKQETDAKINGTISLTDIHNALPK